MNYYDRAFFKRTYNPKADLKRNIRKGKVISVPVAQGGRYSGYPEKSGGRGSVSPRMANGSPHHHSRDRSRSRSRHRRSSYSRSRSRSRTRKAAGYRETSRRAEGGGGRVVGGAGGGGGGGGYRSRSRERRSNSRSPMSSRRRHTGNRDNPSPNKCLGVFGLSLRTTERDLKDVFSRYGPIEECTVVIDAQTGRSRGFAFIYFESVEDAKAAKDSCNGIEIDGRRIRVDFSITQRAHTPTPDAEGMITIGDIDDHHPHIIVGDVILAHDLTVHVGINSSFGNCLNTVGI
ncbi:Transformer-2 protein beta [Orchesella cincta]|uniref:Transformer-2 protein beta n=1 Tax=Orchesella cincta TaxID=48709 RepID=A0A1D2N6S2_ORCCI|nr:Transformer-2 protein beta [Orchesella cincta]